MVSVNWITKVTGQVNASEQVFSPFADTVNFGEFIYSKTIVSNTEGSTQSLSFKDKDGNEAFTISVPDAETTNIFWKTDKDGTPLWGFKVSPCNVYNTFVDANGNYYVLTSTNDPVSFYNSSGTLAQTVDLQAGLSSQTILAKYNASGVLQWVVRFGSNSFVGIPKLKFDSDGSIYAIGNYAANVTIIDTGSTYTITGGSNVDMLVIKFTSAGVKSWSAKMTGADPENIVDVDNSHATNLYLTAVYNSDPLVLTPGTGSVKNIAGGVGSTVGYGLTLALLKETGAYAWAVVFDSSNDLLMAASQSHSSGVYCIGEVPAADVEIKDGDDNVVATIGHDSAENSVGVFITKVSHAGEYLWHARIDGTTDELLTEKFIAGYSQGRYIDSEGNIYFKGVYDGISESSTPPKVYNKDEVEIGSLVDTDLDSLNAFIVKMNSNGTFGWITKIKPESGNEFVVWQMYVGKDDNLYLTGNTDPGEVRFYNEGGSSPVKTITTNTTTFFNPFIFSYSPSGKYRWAVHIQLPTIPPLSVSIKDVIKNKSTVDKKQFLFTYFNNRLVATPEGKVYVNLVGATETDNEIYINNDKVKVLTFDDYNPYLLSLNDTADNNWLTVIAVVLFAALLVLAIALLA